jgi:asparagine synthase (glutamine-hydrolysing)
MFLDTRYFLSDDILAKVDRASMGVSLEARIPFLDREVFDFAWSLPLSLKVRDGRGKHILRRLLDRYVPRNLIERPKQGFAVPVGRWLRKELREWGEALLDPASLAQDGLLEPLAVRRCWVEHQSGRRDHDTRLWIILMLRAWREEQRFVSGAPQLEAAQ